MGLSSGRERDRSGWGERAYAGSRLLGGHELAVLLNARAATDLRDTSGKTALGYARQRRDRIGRVARACRCGRVAHSTRRTNRWTRAARACFASWLVRRCMNEIAPLRQLRR